MGRKGSRWFAAIICLASAGVAWADGVILDGLSPRSIGRGGTNLGFADNGALLNDNPAAAVNIQSTGLLEVGADMMLTDFQYTPGAPRDQTARDTSFTPLPQIAFVQRSDDGLWAYGLGVFTPAGFKTDYDMQGPFPLLGPQHYKSFGMLAKVLPAAACRLTDRLSVGGTLGVAVSHDELQGPYFLQSEGPYRSTPMLLDLRATGAALCWSVGLQYKLTEATTFGATYTSESRFELDGPTIITVPMLGQARYHTRVDMVWPQSVGVGLRHALCAHRAVSVDVLWFNWSQAFDDFGIAFTNPDNPYFPSINERFPLHWRDTVSVRTGYEQKLDWGHTLRCGYVYHQNPVPNATLTPWIPATLEHAFSVGYGLNWRCWDVDLAYMYSFGTPRTVDSSAFVGGDFDQSHQQAQTHCIALSLMRPW